MSSILITGSNGNLGPAVVKRLLNDGFRVIAVTGKHDAGALPQNENLKIVKVDLMDETKTRAFAGSILKDHPDLQAAVLLAGGFAMGNLQETDKAALEKMINLNFYTAYHIIRPLLTYFLNRKAGGQFIMMGSRPGLDAAYGKEFIGYTLSKAMIIKLAEYINAVGKDKGVTATVVVPSTIDTEANQRDMPDADFSKWVPPENIADVISFALSETGRMTRESIIRIYNRS